MTPRRLTVIDLETTGLFPNNHDRIVEIAAVQINPDGSTGQQFETLVNPGRDVGPTHIHGILAGEVLQAPGFEDVAGDFLDFIGGSIIVGHNVTFDLRFIRAELARLGEPVPACPCACTMGLARRFVPSLSCRKLAHICSQLGVAYTEGHSALHDARATAEVLRHLDLISVKRLSEYVRWYPAELSDAPIPWPRMPRTGRAHTRTRAADLRSRKPCYLGQLVARLEQGEWEDASAEEYMFLLDRVLEDRRVTEEEAEQLALCAADLGLCRDDVIALHRQYMRDVIRAALADGIITPPEEADLEEVRQLFGISQAAFDEIIQEERASGPLPRKSGTSPAPSCQGVTVCFTGGLQCRVDGKRASRQVASRIAVDAGMVVKKSVTASLDFLVAADPDSLSGKAQKAHKYGVRVIAEPVFWQMVGVDIE